MMLGNSSLSVDFGDNFSATAAMNPGVPLATNNTEDNDSGEDVVGISWNNYGLTCELHIDMSHIYTTEIDANISVTAVATKPDEISMAKNWTILSVRSPIDEVSLSVKSVLAVQQNVTITASLSPVSQFVKYNWTVSEFDIMQGGMNCRVILSTTTDVPELSLILTDVGDYLINVTVANEISASNADVIITAAEPISSLLLSCDGDKYSSTNVMFDCIAAVEKGTDVGFRWDFGDGISVHVTTSNSSSTATVTYPAAGQYNITVTAWNRLGTEAAWKIVNIVENAFGLSAVAMEPVLIGNRVRVMACCVLGSNVTLEFDFGSGSHQLVLDPESRTVTVSHVYQRTGVYTVSVNAENDVSVAVTHVIVNVLEHISDVDFKPLSVLVAGRHSVFVAIFNGKFSCLF